MGNINHRAEVNNFMLTFRFLFYYLFLVMGAGGLNGEVNTYSSDIDSQLRCNIQRFSREIAASSNLTASSNTSTNLTPSSSLNSRSVSPPASYIRQNNSELNMTCEDCGTNFTLFKRKVNFNFQSLLFLYQVKGLLTYLSHGESAILQKLLTNIVVVV